MAHLITASGYITEVYPLNGEKFSLSELQEYVGGYIEMKEIAFLTEVMVMNEEGAYKDLAKNYFASKVWEIEFHLENNATIVGDILLCNKCEI